ncbi:S100P-binding protein-like isoform X2 [Rhincodon typus]|nr:S100P-binding protein-like isoform X2 [Rhincodon typus]XP_048469172.1 S100P-binding protein-like isoform X2 [Rhincodon typus]XP_048469173.1 S100P-binding protein-like isoform X2 [Rhincodon typus]
MVEQEANPSLNPEERNRSSVRGRGDMENSDLLYHLSHEEFALFSQAPTSGSGRVNERNHAGNGADLGKTLIAKSASHSPNLLKDHNKLMLCEQKFSERVVTFFGEKAKDANGKENVSFPVHRGNAVKKRKTRSSCKSNARKHKQCNVELVKKNLQTHNPDNKTEEHNETRQSTRMIWMSDEEIERRKDLYLRLVSHHVNNGQRIQGPMQELLCLMNQVADREYRNYSSTWQHPSDLTTRNYCRRNANSFRKLNLHEWAISNGRYCRFSGMPDHRFRRPIL